MSNKKVYRARRGAPFSQANAQVYGKEIEEISKKNNGTITPRLVVEEATRRTSPLHNYFEWDKDIASEKYRLHQARMLVGSLVIEIVVNGETPKEQKAYFSVNETPKDNEVNRVYVSYERTLSEPELRKQILDEALSEIDYWQKRYHQYRELSLIFRAIQKTRKKFFK